MPKTNTHHRTPSFYSTTNTSIFATEKKMSIYTLPLLRRETTDDYSAMYTTILDEDDSSDLDLSDARWPKLTIDTTLSLISSFDDTRQTSPFSSNLTSSSSSASGSSLKSFAVSTHMPFSTIMDEQMLHDVANRPYFSEHFSRGPPVSSNSASSSSSVSSSSTTSASSLERCAVSSDLLFNTTKDEQTLSDVANHPHFSEHFSRATCLDPVDPAHLVTTLTTKTESLFVNSDPQETTVTPDQMYIDSRMHLQEEIPKSPSVIRDAEGVLMVYNSSTNKIQFECEECPDKLFQRIHDWRRHKESFHSGVGWPCEVCGHKFARRDALLRHFKVKALKKDGIHPVDSQSRLKKEAKARIRKMACLQEQNE